MYPANPVFVDNDDSRITYTDPSAAREEDQLSSRALELVQSINSTYGGTLAVTTEPGLSFELIFYGRILQIYGAVIPWPINELPRAEYTIDDDGDFEFVPSGTSATSNVTFYVSTLLPLTFHTLTVKVLNATVDAPFLFDYIVYGFLDASEDPNPPNAGSSTSGLASQAQSSPAGTTSTSTPPTLASVSGPAISSSGSATVSPPTIAPDATSVPDRSARSFPTGPVVGAVVGGIALLLVIAAATYWTCRRTKGRRAADRESIESATDGPAPLAPTSILTEKGTRMKPAGVSSTERVGGGSSGLGSEPTSERSSFPPRGCRAREQRQHRLAGARLAATTRKPCYARYYLEKTPRRPCLQFRESRRRMLPRGRTAGASQCGMMGRYLRCARGNDCVVLWFSWLLGRRCRSRNEICVRCVCTYNSSALRPVPAHACADIQFAGTARI